MNQQVVLLALIFAGILAAPAAGQNISHGEDGSQWIMDIPYGEYQYRRHDRHRLNLVIPPKRGQEPIPLVIWIHGGAFWSGSKDDWHPARAMFEKGFAVCSINYRLSNSAPFPAQLQDCKAAIRWIRKHADQYGVDSNHIGVWGASAGGYLAAMLGTTGGIAEFDVGENLDQSSRVQCVIDYYGPTNFLKMNEHGKGQAWSDGLDHDHADSPESLLIGGPLRDNLALVEKADPCRYASQDDPPFLIIHGIRDGLVPHGQSQLLVDALQTVDVSVTFLSPPLAGHGDGCCFWVVFPDIDWLLGWR